MKNWLVYSVLLVTLSFLLASCKLPAPATPEPTQLDPQAVFTSAAQTAEAKRLEMAAQTPNSPVETLIATVAVSSPTPTVPAPVLQGTPTATVGLIPTTAVPAPTGDKAEFVADVSVPDGTVFAPSEEFVKTWRLKNVGSTTWTTDYALVFIDGELMGAPASVPLPNAVAPEEIVEVSVNMVAPAEPGSYRGFWEIKADSGKIFGVGVNANEAIWVDIVVQSALAAGTTPPTTAAGTTIASLSLTVDNPSASGPCPYTLNFSAQFTLNKPATITYRLEVGDSSGSNIRLPLPTTRSLGTGIHAVVYDLAFPQTMSGWARLHITEPEEAFSNQVNFSLTCA